MKGVFVTGTGTEIGKTFVAAGLVYHLQKRGFQVGYFKPIATGGIRKKNGLSSPDVEYVKHLCGTHLAHQGYVFEEPVSPHLASRKTQIPIHLENIASQYLSLCKKYDLLIVEGAGGVAVPINDTGTLMTEVMHTIGLPIVLVGLAGLGTLNHTLLSVNFLQQNGLDILSIVLNKGERQELEQDNQKTLAYLTGIPVAGILPRIPGRVSMRKIQLAIENAEDIFVSVIERILHPKEKHHDS
ncbi:MAG: dethiobiotin synthase [Brevinematales bacterium]|nr:dethiobiotin synthase [Brevinematales bacterium]